MATTDHDSSAELDLGPMGAAGTAPGGVLATPDGEIWLNGDVLACACPRCRAPMSIRLWLMVADCWRCGTSIELTEEQERKALRLLKEHEKAKRIEGEAAAASIRPTMAPGARGKTAPGHVADQRPPAQPQPPPPAATVAAAAVAMPAVPAPPVQRPKAARAPAAPDEAPDRAERLRTIGGAGMLLGGLLANMPAWLISMVVHLVLLLLLGLWYIEPSKPGSDLILASEVGNLGRERHSGSADLDLPQGKGGLSVRVAGLEGHEVDECFLEFLKMDSHLHPVGGVQSLALLFRHFLQPRFEVHGGFRAGSVQGVILCDGRTL